MEAEFMYQDEEVDAVDVPVESEDHVSVEEPSPEDLITPDADDEGKKSNEEVAREVMRGDWGPADGNVRRQALADAGYDPNEIRREIVRLLNS